jgi:CRISPR/Cas system Type II protein with McrA/HNH and RuvC-like nuclease domain
VNPLTDPMQISKDFIGRNLSDTTYISDCVVKIVKNVEKNSSVKIKTCTGKFTAFIRKNIKGYHKSRDMFRHHGIDALCVAYSSFIPAKIQS